MILFPIFTLCSQLTTLQILMLASTTHRIEWKALCVDLQLILFISDFPGHDVCPSPNFCYIPASNPYSMLILIVLLKGRFPYSYSQDFQGSLCSWNLIISLISFAFAYKFINFLIFKLYFLKRLSFNEINLYCFP